MWFYRRLIRIPCKEHWGNEEVLKRIEKKRTLIFRIRTRQLKFIGHMLKKKKFLENMTPTGHKEGKGTEKNNV